MVENWTMNDAWCVGDEFVTQYCCHSTKNPFEKKDNFLFHSIESIYVKRVIIGSTIQQRFDDGNLLNLKVYCLLLFSIVNFQLAPLEKQWEREKTKRWIP